MQVLQSIKTQDLGTSGDLLVMVIRIVVEIVTVIVTRSIMVNNKNNSNSNGKSSPLLDTELKGRHFPGKP